jgi:signal transduction histidine kinase
MGIAPEDQVRIFERFERAVSENYGGFGLGLCISQEVVRAHGGRIFLASAPGQGATFTVELPCSTLTLGDSLSTATRLPWRSSNLTAQAMG